MYCNFLIVHVNVKNIFFKRCNMIVSLKKNPVMVKLTTFTTMSVILTILRTECSLNASVLVKDRE